MYYCFFFSSRRPHSRYWRDWSSDVCSSDLWGIPTAASLVEVKKTVKVPIIASGGLRNGMEMAKCIVLGASMCAMAYPFLLKAAESKEQLFNFADTVIAELKSTMFLIGAMNLSRS